MSTAPGPRSLAPLALVGLAAIAIALMLLWRDESTLEAGAEAPRLWPIGAIASLSTDRPTLLVTIDADSSSAAATIAEVAWLVDRARSPFRATFLVEAPDPVSDDALAATAAYRLASSIAGASIARDRGGHDASLFDAHTSGQSYLYEPNGSLAFAGALSEGRDEVLARIDRVRTMLASSLVFGRPRVGAP